MEGAGATVRETVNASKERIGAAALAALFEGADEVLVAKGKQVLRFDLKHAPPAADALAAAVLGPTGNLRAPSARLGRRWLIGFSEVAYGEALG